MLNAVSVQRGDTWALRDISLRLKAGERWALVGGNGAGKTQLLKLIAADVWPTPTGRESRSYRLGRRPVDLIGAKPRMAYIGAELQDKYARYGWDLVVGDLLATGLHGTDILLQPVTPAELRRVVAMLAICGLNDLAGRRFLSLSYGQKRLGLLARALIRNPDWLLLDEFYNGLDGDYRRRIDDMLWHARQHGQSWIASAHRAMDVPRGTSRMIEMRAGRIVSTQRLTDADLARLRAAASEAPARPIEGSPNTKYPPPDVPGGQSSRDGTASRQPSASSAAGTGGTSPTRRAGKMLVRIERADLYVDYRQVLCDVNWTLREGQQWAIFGANGAGKSSFLKLLYGDLSPALGGVIERCGLARGTPIAAWKALVGLVSPELQTDYAANVSVLELVASGRYASIGLCEAATVADRTVAQHWLKFFSLLAVAERTPRELSYGQLRRVLFARALAGNARILLLDEPLTGLDPRQRTAMKRLLERLMGQKFTLVIAVHHAEDLPRGITHHLNLHKQRAAAIDLHSATQVLGRPNRLRQH